MNLFNFFLFQRLFPYFMNPPFFEPLFLILNGEPGTGRKYFIEQLFFYAQKNKVFEKRSINFSIV